MKAFAQLFDAPAEIVVAYGRVVIAAFSLIATVIDPTQPSSLAPLVDATLMMYAAYAVVLLAALHRRFIHNPRTALVHAIDLAVVALLLLLTDGLSSPFLGLFTFVLLAASLRWDWRGIGVTILVVLLIAALVVGLDGADGRLVNFHLSVIRVAYLIAIGTLLTYANAHREHESQRLSKLAQPPSSPSTSEVSEGLASTLAQAVGIIDAERALVVWTEDDTETKRIAIWRNGECDTLEIPSDSSPITIAPELEGRTFSRILAEPQRVHLPGGSMRAPDAVRGELVSALSLDEFSSSPFRGVSAHGRIFLIGNIRPSDDHLAVTSVIAQRVGAELDREIFLHRATRDAALRERTIIMRDLHDTLLQSLTAARTHLETLPTDQDQAESQLEMIRELLRMEQRRLREFVDATQARDRKFVPIEMLRSRLDETSQIWGCAVSLKLNPASALISQETLNQLALMLAESIANAVRHGEATMVNVAVKFRAGRLAVEIRDNGSGFAGVASTAESEVAEAKLPKTLSARLNELGGRLRAHTSLTGSVLRLELSA